MKNLIFVIEGTDGSGKQTQTKMTAERLRDHGYPVVTHSFPNYDSPSSAPVRMYLGGEFGQNAGALNAYQASTLYAVDRLCTTKILQKSLNKNHIVIFDRYVESNLIHQACKIADSAQRDKFTKWLFDLEYGALELPKPTTVFFLNMPPEQSILLAHSRQDLKAGTAKDIHEQDEKYLAHAYHTGLEIARKQNWKIIDCVNEFGIKSPQQINSEIYKIIEMEIQNNLETLCEK